MAFGQRLEGLVIADDAHDVHIELADALTVEKILEAVVELGHEDQHA